MQPTASLAVLIYNFAGMPFVNQVELAWAAALVLVLLLLAVDLIGQACPVTRIIFNRSPRAMPNVDTPAKQVLEPVVEMAAAQGEDRISSATRPEHSAPLESRTDDGFAAGLDHS